jgi:hypothetical protein
MEDGHSYFAMDYVEGLSIDMYCDTYRLPTVERLKLSNHTLGPCTAPTST